MIIASVLEIFCLHTTQVSVSGIGLYARYSLILKLERPCLNVSWCCHRWVAHRRYRNITFLEAHPFYLSAAGHATLGHYSLKIRIGKVFFSSNCGSSWWSKNLQFFIFIFLLTVRHLEPWWHDCHFYHLYLCSLDLQWKFYFVRFSSFSTHSDLITWVISTVFLVIFCMPCRALIFWRVLESLLSCFHAPSLSGLTFPILSIGSHVSYCMCSFVFLHFYGRFLSIHRLPIFCLFVTYGFGTGRAPDDLTFVPGIRHSLSGALRKYLALP